MAVGLLFLLPGGLVWAQDAGIIEYPENGTGAVATFTGTDPEGQSITWTLKVVAGEDNENFKITGGVLSFDEPPDYETPKGGGADDANATNTYTVTLVASDAPRGGQMAEHTVEVQVQNVDEDGEVTLVLLEPRDGVLYTARTPTDPDGNVTEVEWQWASSDDGSQWTEIAGAVNSVYRPVGDAGKYLRVTATYEDNEGKDKTASAVSAHRVATARTDNMAPVFLDANRIAITTLADDVDEDVAKGTVVVSPTTSDADSDVLTFTLDTDSQTTFAIDRASGVVRTKSELDTETGPTHTIAITATDSSGALNSHTALLTVTLMVDDVDEAPAITLIAASNVTCIKDTCEVAEGDTGVTGVATFTVADEDTDDTVTAEALRPLSGPDSGKFMLAGGELSFNSAPDFEKPGDANRDNIYEVTLSASDDGGNTGSKTVTVEVTNIEEDGEISFPNAQPRVGVAYQAELDDEDGGVGAIDWQWYIDNGVAGATCGGTMIEKGGDTDTYTPKPADLPEDGDAYLCVTATYDDAYASYNDAEELERDMAVAGPALELQMDSTNRAPMFPDQDGDEENGIQNDSAVRYVVEGDTDMMRVVKAKSGQAADSPAAADAVTAEDENVAGEAYDSGDVLTYTLSGRDEGLFSIDSEGVLTTRAKLNHEEASSRSVTVIATDSYGASASIAVTVMVVDVDEIPEIMLDRSAVSGQTSRNYTENARATVARFTARDPEGQAITWTLKVVDAEDDENFKITGGVLSFDEPPDYEDAKGGGADDDGGASNTYTVTLVASDAPRGGKRAEHTVEVQVQNVDEDGEVTLVLLQPREGVLYEANAPTDPDEGVTGVEWQWALSTTRNSGGTPIGTATMNEYTPQVGDAGKYLRVTATYEDNEDKDKTASAVSAHRVATARTDNMAPVFLDANRIAITTLADDVDEDVAKGTVVVSPTTSDADSDVLTFTLDTDSQDTFVIDRASGVVRTKSELDTETGPTHTIAITATDSSGAVNNTAMLTVTLMVDDVDEAPAITLIAASNVTCIKDTCEVAEGDTGVTGVATFTVSDEDTDDTVTAADLRSLSGPDSGKFMLAGGALSFKSAPDFEKPGDANRDNIYEVTLSASDDGGNTGSKTVTVEVTNIEEDGEISFPNAQPRVGVAYQAELDDEDGGVGAIDWQWYIDNGVAGATCGGTMIEKGGDTDTYTPKPADLPEDGDAYLCVTATYDDAYASYNDAEELERDMAVAGPALELQMDSTNRAPMFPDQDGDEENGIQNDSAVRYVVEGDTDMMRVVKAKSGQAADSPAAADAVTAEDENVAGEAYDSGDVLTYTLSGRDEGLFSIDSVTGVLTTDAELDYEEASSRSVTVIATDSYGASASIAVTVMVVDVDEAPVIKVGGLAISGKPSVDYAENGTGAVETYRASGPDAASATWTLEGADAGDFRISSGGMLTFRSSPDYENPMDADMDNMYMVTVKASDGTYMDTHAVMVMVTNEDELGMLLGQDSVGYMENDTVAVGTYTADGPVAASWSLEGDDMGAFTIGGSSGELVFASPPDFEAPTDMGMDNMYQVTVKAEAGGEMDMMDVTVTVTNVDEAPVITGDAARNYAENGTDPVATYSATDPEGADIIWSLGGDDAADFEISDGGELTFVGVPDYENAADANTDNTYMVTVVASDGTNEERLAVTITVTNVDEAPPVITGDAALDYAENGTDPVATYSATDPDSATTTWSLGGDDAADFEISADGVLAFKSSPDYEAAADDDTDNAYEVTVVASDGTYSDTQDVAVTVTDVDEAPVITGDVAPNYAENGTAAVATYSATDPESATITWSLGGDDAADFEISADGVLTFKSSPDYEAAADDDTDNAYEVTVVASDGANEGGLDVTVTVTDVDEDVAPADPVGRYDKNNNGRIDKDELVDGVFDYNVEQTLSKDDLADLIFSYEIG